MSETPIISRDGGPLADADIEANFGDLHAPLTGHQAQVESARCLYCYDAPCIKACPTSIDIPTFIHQIRADNALGAAETILEANIMGGTCARVCPTEELCEEACVRNTCEDKPIEIGQLQRFAVDRLMEAGGDHPFERAPATGKTVGIVGAGPAGLACAHALACAGHDVAVYEARPKPGGLNEYGIAAYKMIDDFAQAEVDFITQVGGVTLQYETALGSDISLDDLQAKHDAVFIGVGLDATRAIGIEGSGLKGIENAVDFIARLRQAQSPADVRLEGSVVVIGGGNTAIDAAIQAKRLGAEDVTLVYRRGADAMAATQWEQDLAQKNGVLVKHWAQPTGFEGSDGRVTTAVFERTRATDTGLEGTGRALRVAADHVFLAIGQVMDEGPLADLECMGGKIAVDAAYRTSRAGVYAGGDCVKSGVDLTVQAVEDGKQAARAIHQDLMASGAQQAAE